jgi:hypothetical protein
LDNKVLILFQNAAKEIVYFDHNWKMIHLRMIIAKICNLKLYDFNLAVRPDEYISEDTDFFPIGKYSNTMMPDLCRTWKLL